MKFLSTLSLGVLAALAVPAQAQDFPGSAPIVAVVPFAAGGPTDKVARDVTAVMAKHLKGQIVIENVGGAGGTIGAKKVATARNDGHTVLIHHIGMSTAPALYRQLGFDPLKDFEMIGEIADVPMVLLGTKSLPPDNFKDLLPYIKANSSKLFLANAGIGSASHLCGLLFMSTIGTQLGTVPYKGTAPALTDLIQGHPRRGRAGAAGHRGQDLARDVRAQGHAAGGGREVVGRVAGGGPGSRVPREDGGTGRAGGDRRAGPT